MAMKILVIFAMLCLTVAEQTNPIQKVIELISSLEAKLIKEGEAEEKAYKEFFAWCDDAAANKKFEIKTATAKKEKLEATISEAESNAQSAAASIEELSGQISVDQADLKAATDIRGKENKEFLANEAELSDAVDTLGRAISVLERQGVQLLQAPVDTK